MKLLEKYKFNTPATLLVGILVANFFYTFFTFNSNFFLALVQVGFSFGIAYLGNKAEIYENKN